MADEKRLFDKPMTELREAFVRARFAQDDVFGRPDIEEWLVVQRTTKRPIEHMWRRFIDAERVQRPFHIRELPDLAVPQDLPRGFSIKQMADVGDPLVAMLCESVDRKRVDVLPAGERLTLFLLKGENGAPAHVFALTPQFKKRRSGDPLAYTLYVPGDKDLLQVVLSRGWSAGPKKIATAARRLLCDGLEACIREERAKAEADFDTAVAVSADGTKIVHADWVVVTGLGTITSGHPRYGQTVEERFRVFPGAVFRDRKILRTEEYVRIDPYVPNDSFSLGKNFSTLPVESQIARVLRRAEHPSLLDDCVRSEERQMFVRLSVLFGLENVESTRWKIDLRTTIFITDVRHCPSPLPDGDVEVTV